MKTRILGALPFFERYAPKIHNIQAELLKVDIDLTSKVQ